MGSYRAHFGRSAALAAMLLVGLTLTPAVLSQPRDRPQSDYFNTGRDAHCDVQRGMGTADHCDAGLDQTPRGRDAQCGGTSREFYNRAYGVPAQVIPNEEVPEHARRQEILRCGACGPGMAICWLKPGVGVYSPDAAPGGRQPPFQLDAQQGRDLDQDPPEGGGLRPRYPTPQAVPDPKQLRGSAGGGRQTGSEQPRLRPETARTQTPQQPARWTGHGNAGAHPTPPILVGQLLVYYWERKIERGKPPRPVRVKITINIEIWDPTDLRVWPKPADPFVNVIGERNRETGYAVNPDDTFVVSSLSAAGSWRGRSAKEYESVVRLHEPTRAEVAAWWKKQGR